MSDLTSTPSVNEEAKNFVRDENIPLDVLYSAPTQVAAPIKIQHSDRFDLSTLSGTNDECCSESATGACSTNNILHQIGQSFSNLFFGCNSPKGMSGLKEENETYTYRTHVEGTTIGTVTTDGSIECPSPCCSPTNLSSPSGMSMVAHPSLSSYQRGKSSTKQMRVATKETNEESWDDAFRKGSFASPRSTSATSSRTSHRPNKTKKKGTAQNSSHYSTPKKGRRTSIRRANEVASKKNTCMQKGETSISDPSFHLRGSAISKGSISTAGTSRRGKDLTFPSSPTTLQSPMSSLSRSSAASSSRASKSRNVPVQQAMPPYPMDFPNQVNYRRGLGMVTGKKRIVLPPGYLHNFEITDDPTSFSAGPVVSWVPATNNTQGAVGIGDHVVKVNNKDTRRSTALDVSRLLHTKRHKERTVWLSFQSFS